MIVSLEHISKWFGASIILNDINARIDDNDKIGLIGANGAGKSTLLNVLYGDLIPDEGEIAYSGKSFGFLRQNSGLDHKNSILEEMRSVFSKLFEIESELRTLELEMAEIAHTGEHYLTLTKRYTYLNEIFEQGEGYIIDVKIKTILGGMGFLSANLDTPIALLSGGEKTRLALCKLLLEQPELLILDEPTNHLDFKTLIWLEDYLKSYKGALLIVSHDRYFLDKLSTVIWDLSDRKLTAYNGNYSSYLLQKRDRDERQLKEYEMQQQEIVELKDFVARNMARASTTARAKSRQKVLDKMDVVEKPTPPKRPAKIRFDYKREPVKDVLAVTSLTLSVGDGETKTLLSDIDFSLIKGEKIAIIGANGIGKSSFLKVLLSQIPIDKGRIEWGRNTDISYFEQEEFALDSQKTVLSELWDRFPREYEHTIRTTLGNVGITGQEVYKRVGDLSGGERAKLKFALLILSCGNVLLMDEPTNHLDLPTKEALDEALCAYTGSLIIVSHDRYLLSKVPQKIAEMYNDHIKIYSGGYESYLEQKSAQPSPPSPAKHKPKEEKDPSYRGKKQRSEEAALKQTIQRLEGEIETLEGLILSLESEILKPEISSDYKLLEENCAALETARHHLDEKLSQWSVLS